MKKLLALALVVFGLAACQTEPEGLDVNMGGEQEVMLTVSLPEATRANSANGFQIADLGSTYDLRYILEVYRADDEGNILYENCQRQVKLADAATMSFPVRLAPEYNYQIVAWADIVDNGSYNDRIYKTDNGLDAIEIIESMWKPMDETRDAYTAVKVVNDFNSSSNLDMTLTRPFAKVRVVATDINDITDLGLSPKAAKVSYLQNMYTKYNAVTNEASAAQAKSHEYTTFPYDDAVGEKTLFADYVFVPESGTAKFSLNVYDDEAATRLIKENSFSTDIFVERNKITTIKGDVLTQGGNVSVKVENDLGEKVTISVVDTAEALMEQFEQLEDDDVDEVFIELGGDIDLNDLLGAGILSTRAAEPTYGLLIPADKSVVLDLKGFTISQTKAQSGKYAMIENNGTLTICNSANTNGVISYGDTAILTADVGYASNTIQNNGTLTINEGVTLLNTSGTDVATYGYPHVIDTNGKLTINGGVLTNEANYSTMRIWTSNTDSEKCVVTIEGGTFNGCIDFQAHNNNYPTIPHYGTLTVNGGTFNPDTFTKSAIRVLRFAVNAEDMHATINDGNFNGKILVRNFGTFTETPKIFDICGGTFNTAAKEGTDEALINDDYQFDQNGEYWVVEKKPTIAEIGEVGYTSLQKAVAEAQNGDTVLFVADVEQEDGVIITDKNITIDLNGNTFTVSNGASTNNRNFKVNGSSVVTIKNGNMVAAGDYSSGAYGTLRTEGTANVTLEDVKLYNYRGNGLNVKALSGTTVTINDTEIYSQYGGGVEAAGGTVELTNVKIEQEGMYTAPYNSMAISVNGGGTATVNSGTYSTECLTAEEANNQGTSHGPWCAGVLNSGGTLIIKGGTFSNDNFGDNLLATYARGLLLADTAANIQIEGGVFNAVKAIIDMTNNLGDASRNPSATISGGVFSADPRISGLYASHLISIADGYKVVEDNGIWTVVVDPAAKIGETEYASLQEAFNVGGNITLLRNVTLAETVVLAEGKTVVLDLNDKTLAAEDKNTIKNNGGNLTLKNGTVTRTGDVVGYSVNNASGEINVVDATVERGLYTSGSKMTATNANISHEQSSRHAIYAWDCEVTINSGIFHNDNAGNATLMASGSSVVTINGGTFSIADGRSALGWTSSMIDQNNTAQVIVKGGLFNGGFRINSADTTLTIEGGEFNTNNGSSFTDYSGTKVVKGGKFTDTGAQNWAKKYIAEGYEMNANGEVVAK